jgi:hypothetical protein
MRKIDYSSAPWLLKAGTNLPYDTNHLLFYQRAPVPDHLFTALILLYHPSVPKVFKN